MQQGRNYNARSTIFNFAVHKRIEYFNTRRGSNETAIQTLSTFSDWFDDNSVDPSKYPDMYTKAIETQTATGWNHLFHWTPLSRLGLDTGGPAGELEIKNYSQDALGPPK